MKRTIKITSVVALATIIACVAASLGISPPARAAEGVITTSPSNGANVTGPITISGTYEDMYRIVIAFNAGTFYDAHVSDPDGDETGTWSFDWDPAGYYGNVEITVRGFALSDRYFRWADPVNVTVNISDYEPPAVSIVSPDDGDSVSGTVPVTVSASDTQGLSSVQVRIDWGSWQTASPSGGNYVYNWDTSGEGNKTHCVEARATDTDGNVTKTATNYVKTGTGTSESPQVKMSDRALWLWEPAAYQLLENSGARDVLDEFLTDKGINTIYFYADRYDGGYTLVDNPAQYRSFISWAHSEGYYVHALLASSFYAAPMYVYPRYNDKAVELIENVLNYNISSAANERFDGSNVDIEPHGLPEWVTGSPDIQVAWLDMLSAMMDRKAASGQNLNVGPAAPRWLDLNGECRRITWNGETKWQAEHMIDISDYYAIMDYRDVSGGPSGIIKHAQGEIDYADSVGKLVVVGVETDWISPTGDPEKITFHEEGEDWMETELAAVNTAFASNPSYAGIAIHHYDSYVPLPSIQSPNGTYWQTTVSDSANPGTPGSLTATTWDWQRIDLHWDRVSDDVQVSHYEIHRSTSSGFTPSSATLARKTIFNFAKDWGLLANTTYYYKIIAVDLAGNSGTASAQASASTDTGVGLDPMHIGDIYVTAGSGTASGYVKMVDGSGSPLNGINVFGCWDLAAGKPFDGNTGSDGYYTSNSEVVEHPDDYSAAYVPEKILGDGYYWAFSEDVAHSASDSYSTGGSPTDTPEPGPTDTPAPPPTDTPIPPTDTPAPPTDTPEPGGVMHVDDIAMSCSQQAVFYKAVATVTILDASDQPVGTATVYGTFSGASSDSVDGDTAGDGTVTFESSKVKNGGTWTFTVDDVVKSGWTYDENANVETSDSITCP